MSCYCGEHVSRKARVAGQWSTAAATRGVAVASNRMLQLTGSDMLFGCYVDADGHPQHVEQLVKGASEWDAFESLLPFWLWRFFYTKQELERRGQVVEVGAARRRLACSKVAKNGVQRRPSIEGAEREHINPVRIRRERMTI